MRGGDEVDYRLIISDEYVRACGEYIENQGKRFDQFFSDYLSILQELLDSGFSQGQIYYGLNIFVECAEEIKGIVSDTSDMINNTTDCFISDIDEADWFIN